MAAILGEYKAKSRRQLLTLRLLLPPNKTLPQKKSASSPGGAACNLTNANPRLQFLSVSSAQPKSDAILQQHLILSILAKLQASHPLQIHNRRPMHSAKDRLIQLLFQFRQTSPQQMASRSYVQTSVIVGRLNPINLGDLYKHNSPGALYHQSLGVGQATRSRHIPAMRNSLFRPPQRQIESIIVKRLQQIIERPRLKSPQRILVVGGHKNNGRRQILT